MTVQVSLRLSEDLHRRLKAAAEADLRSLHSEVVWLLEEALATRDQASERPLHRCRDPVRLRRHVGDRHRPRGGAGDAWRAGAWAWPAAKRLALANDPLNLLAVDSGANRSKGDDDASTWLPDRTSYRCAHVARQVAVKHEYQLAVSSTERAMMTGVRRSCRNQPAPYGGTPTLAPSSLLASHAPATTRKPVPPKPKPAPAKPALQPKPAPQPRTDPRFGPHQAGRPRGDRVVDSDSASE